MFMSLVQPIPRVDPPAGLSVCVVVWVFTEGIPISFTMDWLASVLNDGVLQWEALGSELTAPQLPHFLPPPEMPAPHLGQLLWPIVYGWWMVFWVVCFEFCAGESVGCGGLVCDNVWFGGVVSAG